MYLSDKRLDGNQIPYKLSLGKIEIYFLQTSVISWSYLICTYPCRVFFPSCMVGYKSYTIYGLMYFGTSVPGTALTKRTSSRCSSKWPSPKCWKPTSGGGVVPCMLQERRAPASSSLEKRSRLFKNMWILNNHGQT